MKKLIVFLFCFVAFGLSAQTVRFNYDDCGNRTARYVEAKKDSDNDFKSDIINAELKENAEKLIEIFPNPSQGHVCVKLTNFQTFENSFLELFSSNGSLLKKWTISKSKTDIDLKAFKDGVYILKLSSSQTQHIEKLVKY